MSWRPWTAAAKRVAQLRGNKRKPLEPIRKWNVVRGDLVSLIAAVRCTILLKTRIVNCIPQVEILAGKDKGKQGNVSVVARRQHQVIVSGLNTVSFASTEIFLYMYLGLGLVLQHIRVLPPSGEFPGGRVPSEAPLHISNVALVDPKDGYVLFNTHLTMF